MKMFRKLNIIAFLTYSFLILLSTIIYINNCKAQNYPATTSDVVHYAQELSLSIVDTSFRGSWVIAPDHLSKIKENTKKLQKPFDSLANIKIGSSNREVRKALGNPVEKRNNGEIWIYGNKNKESGSYDSLIEVFFNSNLDQVIGVISFDKENLTENIAVNIGDPIEKVIDIYGEPVNEEDFIEDHDNKHYLGMYYLYPRTGIGFLIGQDKENNNLLIQGVLVFGKS